MTLLNDAPAQVEDAVREALPPAHVSSPLRNTAMLLVAALVLMVGLFVALVLFDSEGAEIHDSWMNDPGAVQTAEIHDSWISG